MNIYMYFFFLLLCTFFNGVFIYWKKIRESFFPNLVKRWGKRENSLLWVLFSPPFFSVAKWSFRVLFLTFSVVKELGLSLFFFYFSQIGELRNSWEFWEKREMQYLWENREKGKKTEKIWILIISFDIQTHLAFFFFLFPRFIIQREYQYWS